MIKKWIASVSKSQGLRKGKFSEKDAKNVEDCLSVWCKFR